MVYRWHGRFYNAIRRVLLENNTVKRKDYVPKKHILNSKTWYYGNIGGHLNRPMIPDWYLGKYSTQKDARLLS